MPSTKRFRKSVLRPKSVEPLEDRRLMAVSFGVTNPVATGNIGQVAVGDLNRDGRDDLVYEVGFSEAGPAPGIYAALSHPDGTFGTPTRVAADGSFALADINGDGTPDLALNIRGQGNILLLPGRGDGTFDPSGIPSILTPESRVQIDGVGDFNGDGRPDVLYSTQRPYNSDVPIYDETVGLSQADGSLRPIAFANYGAGSAAPAIADFNGDGKADVAQASFRDTGPGTIQFSWGDGTFTDPVLADPSDPVAPIEPALAADFNGDGKPDLLSLALVRGAGPGPGGGVLGGPGGVSLNVGDGTFRPPVSLPILSQASAQAGDGPGYKNAVAGDFDGDGNLDLIATHAITVIEDAAANANGALTVVGDAYYFLHGNGDGTFATPVSFGTTGLDSSDQLGAGDFNGDGRPDLLTVGDRNAPGVVSIDPHLGLNIRLNSTPPISGALDPASDTGVSDADHVTNDTTPTFAGQATPGAVVTLFAQAQGASAPTQVGSATAGADGTWRITASALADGIYTITASIPSIGGPASSLPTEPATTAILAGGNSALVVSTTAPVVTAATVSPSTGQVRVTIRPGVAGFYSSTLQDPSEFVLTNARGQVIPISSVKLSQAGPIVGEVQLIATVAGGRLGAGVYTLRLRSSAVQDRAGNVLAGVLTAGPRGTVVRSAGDSIGRFAVLGRFSTPVLPVVLPRPRARA